MVDFGSILASILAKGLGIELKFIDKSTGKTKIKTSEKVNAGVVVKTKGKNNTINLFVNNGSLATESKPAAKELSEAFSRSEINYLMAPAKEKLTEFREYENRISRNKIITTFSGILPTRHVALIKTGLYIGILGNENQQDEVNKVYTSLINYSAEERYIVNLASAGHFTHYILPTFNEFKSLNDGLNRFLEHYYKIINGSELALFVHRSMSAKDIYNNVIYMAKKNIKYGVVRHKIYVHATGQSNVEILNSAYVEIKKMFPQAVKKRLSREIPNLTIKIPYQVNNLTADD